MARFARHEVYHRMTTCGIVTVANATTLAAAQLLIRACYGAGIGAFEFTYRDDSAMAVLTELLPWVRAHCPDLALGVGTVLDAPTAAHFLAKGVDFIVSPLVSPEIAELCNRRRIAWIPGCGTVTEISLAEALGAEILKVFPANALGPAFVQSVRGPLPWTRLMPTGGVGLTVEALRPWFQAGVACVGVGSVLFGSATHEVAALTTQVQTAVQAVQIARQF